MSCWSLADIALGITEACKPSHHFKVHTPGDVEGMNGQIDCLA